MTLMAHTINSIPALPAFVPRMTPAKGTSAGGGGKEPVAKTPSERGKSVLGTAFDMHDDLSALVSSLARRRQGESGATASGNWAEHVLEDAAPEKLVSLKQQLLAGNALDSVQIKALVAALFPDPSDAVLVLRTLLADEDLLELRALLEELLDAATRPAERKAINAGINVAIRAKLSAARLSTSPKNLRASYRDLLLGSEPIDTYEMWIEMYGFERRANVVDFMEQALVADMYALDPSCSRVEFGRPMSTLRGLTAVRSADALLMKHCWRGKLMATLDVSEKGLLLDMLKVVRSGEGVRNLFESIIAKETSGLAIADKVLLAQGLKLFCIALPPAIWCDKAACEHAQDEVETLLRKLIASEEMDTPHSVRLPV